MRGRPIRPWATLAPVEARRDGELRQPARRTDAHSRPKKLGVVLASALVATNIWTGAPLVALWVGSQVQRSMGHLSLTALFTVLVVFATLAFALSWMLARLNARYDELTGRPPERRQPLPWLRSLRGERENEARGRLGISAVERVVVITVVAAVVAFEAWFFLLAGSPLPATP
jgi:hypothetical protein